MRTIRIGFIAMSGVRVQNPELLAAGLTLPGFVERSEVIASLPSLSLLTLAALTPPHCKVEYHDIESLDAAGTLPDHYDLVAITSLTAQIRDAYGVADRFRAQGATVVMGGLHVTALPDEALAHCDAAVIGEGEPVWPQVVDDFLRGSLARRYSASPAGRFDLAQAPLPRFDLLDPNRYNRITVQTSRGCPHRCEFCASSILLTPAYKLKPIDKVLAEVAAIKRIWPQPFIEFADDNSFVHREHYRALMRALAPQRLKWFTETDVSVAQDPDLLGLMRDAGCQQVLIGLESPTRAGVGRVETRADWKARRVDGYLEAIRRIQSYGITVNGCFILGLDGDTPDVFDEVFRFVRESGLYEVQVTLMTAFPGTPLYDRLLADGRLLEPDAWERCTLFDVNFRPKYLSPAELEHRFRDLVVRLYSREETSRRRRQFFRARRAARRYNPAHDARRDRSVLHQPPAPVDVA